MFFGGGVGVGRRVGPGAHTWFQHRLLEGNQGQVRRGGGVMWHHAGVKVKKFSLVLSQIVFDLRRGGWTAKE